MSRLTLKSGVAMEKEFQKKWGKEKKKEAGEDEDFLMDLDEEDPVW